MASRRAPGDNPVVWVALGVSCAIHVGVLGLVAHWIGEPEADETRREAKTRPAQKLNVQMRAETDPIETSEPERDDRSDDEPEEQEEEEKREKIRDYEDTKAVQQETNEEQPDEADYVSSEANKTDRETRARETTDEPTDSSADDEAQQQPADSEQTEQKLGSKLAARSESSPEPPTSESTPPPEPDSQQREETSDSAEQPSEQDRAETDREETPGPTGEQAPEESTEGEESPPPPPMPSPGDYDEVFDASEDRKKMREHAEKGVGSDMFKRMKRSDGAVREAMENHIAEVQPGNHTSVNARADAAATYVNEIHSKIHPQWGGEFLPRLDRRFGPGSPLSDSDLNAVLEFVVDGDSGELEEVTIAESSGQTTYDMEAVAIAKSVAPHPEAPDEIVSPDGNVYLHWNFWRDQR